MNEPEVVNVDPNEVVQRILKVKRGELPPDAVSVAELRAALSQTRKGYAAGAEAAEKVKEGKKPAGRKAGGLDTSVLGDMFE